MVLLKKKRLAPAPSFKPTALSRQFSANQAQFETLPRPTLNSPVLVFDCEYVFDPVTGSNRVLCYTFAIGQGGRYITGYLPTQSGEKRHRLKFEQLIKKAVEAGLKAGVLTEWPETLIVAAHFLRADLYSLAEAFKDFKTKVKGIRKTVTSLDEAYGVELGDQSVFEADYRTYDAQNNRRVISVRFYDSMLLAPAGRSLAAIGELVGLPKVTIPAPYSIEAMDVFQREAPDAFKAYAIADAEICYLYMQKMICFAEELGLNSLPVTVGGLSQKLFLQNLKDKEALRVSEAGGATECLEVAATQGGSTASKATSKGIPFQQRVFGLVQKTQVHYDSRNKQPRTFKGLVPGPARQDFEDLAIRCYSGGRNESFWVGPTEVDTWWDFDVPSCYTVAAAGLYPLDYEAAEQIKSVDPLLARVTDGVGLIRAEFRFPETVNFPCLPVKTPEQGLVFPLTGISECTLFELALAHRLGAELEIKQGIFVPWLAGSEPVFLDFMKFVREKRRAYPKGSFEERLWKEIGNSLYGKTGQGLAGKTAFDIEKGISSKIPPSKITNPYFASYIAGFCRALLSEMLISIPQDYRVISVTTDGFLTNAPLEQIDLQGPICQAFRQLYHQIDAEGGEILECKHRVQQLIAMKTRGQLTVVPYEQEPQVIAKAGVQVPEEIEDPMSYMVNLYLDRQPGQKVISRRLISTREQLTAERDLVGIEQEVTLNLEPDSKRQWLAPRQQALEGDYQGRSHLALDSKPLVCVEEALWHKERFKVWREEHCLKTLEDWWAWHEFSVLSKAAASTKLRLKPNESSDQLLLRLFFRVYAQEALQVPRIDSFASLAARLTEAGYPCHGRHFSSAKRLRLQLGVVPWTERVQQLMEQLLWLLPDWSPEQASQLLIESDRARFLAACYPSTS